MSEQSEGVGEISYDLIMNDDMSFIEGCYRLPGGVWEVIIISKWSKWDVTAPTHKLTSWESGVTGVYIQVPHAMRLNAQVTESLLTSIFNVQHWVTVRGPDSIVLR
jgi:hypothetical protein